MPGYPARTATNSAVARPSVNQENVRITQATAVRLIGPMAYSGHLGVLDRLHASTTVVSTALAAGLWAWRPLTFRLFRRGVESGLPAPPRDEV